MSKDQRALSISYQVCFLNSLPSTKFLQPCSACGAQKAFSMALMLALDLTTLFRWFLEPFGCLLLILGAFWMLACLLFPGGF